MVKRKSIMLSPEDYAKSKRFGCDDNYSPAFIAKSLLNAAINRVNYAKKKGIVPETTKKTNGEYSDYLIFCALHYREVGKITEELFQKHIDNLPSYIFAANMENIEFDRILTPDLTDTEREILILEEKLWLLKAEDRAEKELKGK